MKNIDYENAIFLGARHSDATSNVTAHNHDYYELNFLTSGKTRMLVNEKVIEYDSYDFILIPPTIKHILHESAFKKFDNYVIWFNTGEIQLQSNHIIKLHDYDGDVQFLCSEIYRHYTTNGFEDLELINLYLKAVLWHIEKGIVIDTGKHSKKDDDLVDSAIKFINSNIFDTFITVEYIAKRLNVSSAYFTRTFNKKIGTSPVKYINEVKIATAKRLLAADNYSIKEISIMLNYTDQFYFSKQFKALTGLSPTEYRRKKLNI